MKFTSDMLFGLGFPQGKTFGQLLKVFNSGNYTENGFRELVQGFINHKLPKNINSASGSIPVSLELMKIFFDYEAENKKNEMKILDTPLPYNVFGVENIEKGAIEQMNNAMRLPISVAGAVMPDSHLGYGIPIGGVLATDNVVIPNAVGVDIACMMKLSVFDIEFPTRNTLFKEEIRKAMNSQTIFGTGLIEKDTLLKDVSKLPVLMDSSWEDIPFLKKFNLRDQAIKQIGTSGNGNHFVSSGFLKTNDGRERFAILSHSGSRGIGYKVAKFYHGLAMKKFDNKDFNNFAWLDLESDEGQEYWAAMNLCSDFAHASHKLIHDRLSKYMKIGSVETYSTNHNIAFKETHTINGSVQEVIVHRKGAVRAFKDEFGLIGGSMSTPSFLVQGKGNEASLCSCSHGSGRAMSRTVAKQTFTKAQMIEDLKNAGVELLDGGLDECSMAYKDVHQVMIAQKDLVEIVGEFNPRIVIMGEGDDE